MTDPTRWVRSGSDADPVLRSVLRYAQTREPDPSQVHALLERAEARVPRRRQSRTFFSRLAAAALLAGVGVAFAAVKSLRTPSNDADVADASPEPRAARPASGSERMLPAPPVPAVAPFESAPSSKPPLSPSSTAPTSEVGLLAEARQKLARNPSLALTLTRKHTAAYPDSALREERDALEIEALFRLGRRSDAERRLSDFEQRFPKSVHLRRLKLVAP